METESNPFDTLDAASQREPQSLAVGAIAEAEISQQIATAQRYPKHSTVAQIRSVRERVLALAKSSPEVSAECFYRLKRKGKDETGAKVDKIITGPSVRFAELVASVWGNCRVGSRVIEENERFLTAQGVFHDLETNVAWNSEVRVRIAGKFGKYSDDMVAVAANSACSKAARNALFKGVPKAYWNDLHEEVMKHAIGDAKSLAERRDKAVEHFKKMGVSEADLLRWLSNDQRKVATVREIDGEMVADLRALATSIKDGETTIDEEFREQPPEPSATQQDAPPETRVNDAAGLGAVEPTPPQPPPAEKAKKREPNPKAEPAAATPPPPPPPASTPPPPSPPAASVSSTPAQPDVVSVGDATPPPVELPSIEKSAVLFGLSWEAQDGHAPGTIRYRGPSEGFARFDGEEWHVLDDKQSEAAHARVVLAATTRITQQAKRANLNRDALFGQITETLKLSKPPAQLAALTLDQLLHYMRTTDG